MQRFKGGEGGGGEKGKRKCSHKIGNAKPLIFGYVLNFLNSEYLNSKTKA